MVSNFVPAQNSRHRTAALALYRALVREGKKVQLPPDVQKPSLNHPVAHLVRKRFAKNKAYTSFRLTYAALAAGYNFLTLFAKARTPDSPEHAEIVSFLRSRQTAAATSRAALPPRPPRPEAGPPLLTNIARPGELPHYISTVRPAPKSALRGERRVPSLAATADGLPFLRTKKPQSKMLSKIIGLKGKSYVHKMETYKDINDNLIPDAALEDQWERLVAQQMREETVPVKDTDTTQSYTWSAQLGRLGIMWQLEMMWQDWIARGEALQRIVEEERVLAAEEKGEPAPPTGNSRDAKTPLRAARGQRDPRGSRVQVANPEKQQLTLVLAANKGYDASAPPDEDNRDPFNTSLWTALVKDQQGRLLRRTETTIRGASSGFDEIDTAWR